MQNQFISNAIKSRLIIGFSAQGFGQAIQIIVRLVEVPLFIGLWGTQLYGEWLMIAVFPAYLAICDGGFVGAASREMSIRGGAGDKEGALSIFQSVWALLLAISAAVLLIAYLLIRIIPLTNWLGVTILNSSELNAVLLLRVVHVLVSFYGGLLNGGFWCTGRYPMGMILMTITQLLEFIGLAGALVLGGGPVHAAFAYTAGRLLGTLFAWCSLRSATPWLQLGFRNASCSNLRRIFTPAFSSLAFPFGNAFNVEGMRLIVGLLLGPAAVAVFSSMRTLSRFAIQPLMMINRIIEPELALSFGNNDIKLSGELFARASQIALWGSLSIGLVLVMASNWLFPIWTSGRIQIQWTLYLLLLSAVLINAMWYTALMVPYATNRYGRIAFAYALVYGVSAFMLGYLGVNVFGLNGVGGALLAVEITMTLCVIPIALKQSCKPFGEWLRIIIYPPLFLFKHSSIVMRMIWSIRNWRNRA